MITESCLSWLCMAFSSRCPENHWSSGDTATAYQFITFTNLNLPHKRVHMDRGGSGEWMPSPASTPRPRNGLASTRSNLPSPRVLDARADSLDERAKELDPSGDQWFDFDDTISATSTATFDGASSPRSVGSPRSPHSRMSTMTDSMSITSMDSPRKGEMMEWSQGVMAHKDCLEKWLSGKQPSCSTCRRGLRTLTGTTMACGVVKDAMTRYPDDKG